MNILPNKNHRHERGIALILALFLMVLLLTLSLAFLALARSEARTSRGMTDLAAIHAAELGYAVVNSGNFTTNLPALGLPTQTNGFTFSVATNSSPAYAYAFSAELAHWGITNASFSVALVSNAPVVAHFIPGEANARRAALDRITSNGIVTIQNIFATNPPSLRAQAVGVASSLSQIFSHFTQLDANGDGSLGWHEILAAETNTATPLGAFLNYTRNELSLGAAGEDIASLPGIRFSDIANNSLTVTLPSVLALTNTPAAPWPLRGIVYSRTNSIGAPTVYLCTADGAADRVLLSNATWPRISPDGRWMVYHYMNIPTAHPRTQQIRVHDLLKGDDATSDTVLVSPIVDAYLYEFTADSSKVVFDFGGMLWRPRDNSLPQQVIFNSPNLQGPARNPVTGQFIGANGQRLRLFNFNPANTNLPPNVRDLPNSINNDQWAAWSPDGQWIAAYNYNNALTDEYWFKIRPDGSQRTRLSFLPNFSVSSHPNAAWTPDGQWLVVIATVGGTNGLWALATDGSGAMRRLPSNYGPGAGTFYDFVGAATVNLPFPSPPVFAQNFAVNTSASLTNYAVSNAVLNLRASASAFAKIYQPNDPVKPLAALYLAADSGAGISLRSGAGVSPALSVGNLELGSASLAPQAGGTPAPLNVRLRGAGRIAGNVFNLGGLVSAPTDPMRNAGVNAVTERAFAPDPALPGDPTPVLTPVFPATENFPGPSVAPGVMTFSPDPLHPGDPIRVLTVAGNYFQSSAGVLGLVVGDSTGATASYDQLQVLGAATLSGTLSVALAGATNGASTNAYVPQAGDRFDVISAPKLVLENLTLLAPRFGHGLALTAGVTTNNSGAQVLRLLVVTNAPLLLSARGVDAASPTNGTLTLDWPINYPTNFTLQSNTNLTTTNWVDVSVGTNVTTLTVTNAAANGQGYYRLKVP